MELDSKALNKYVTTGIIITFLYVAQTYKTETFIIVPLLPGSTGTTHSCSRKCTSSTAHCNCVSLIKYIKGVDKMFK